MSKPTPGLRKRGQYWHIEKVIAGRRLCESTGEATLEGAERYLAKRVGEIRGARIYGDAPVRTFDDAAAKYIDESAKKSLGRDIVTIKAVWPYIGKLPLSEVHAGTLDSFIADRLAAGITAGTLKRDIAVIRQILTLASSLWRDVNGKPWLASVPMLPKVRGEPRKPRPISHDEQAKLFKALPGYLAEMALFAVHTGCRDQEICGLRWEWEHEVTGTAYTVFVLPAEATKNGKERIIPLNAVARSVVDGRRGQDQAWVFAHNGHKLHRMNNRAWIKARDSAGLPDVRVHDLRHTFGNRLRYAGVGFEDRQDLLGHHAKRITSHYSRAEIERLIEAAETLCEAQKRKPEIALVRKIRHP
ncbi:MAG: site-specific integrase [Opitutae bacterium]